MFDVLKPSREVGDTATADAQTAQKCKKTILFN
jgi:hypothetical protein